MLVVAADLSLLVMEETVGVVKETHLDGTANTGGGGGGGYPHTTSHAGGSGIVVVRYRLT